MEGVKDVQGGTVRSSAPGLHGGRDETREAARVFGLHRDTVRKMLAYSMPPGYRRQTPPRRRNNLPGCCGGFPGRSPPTHVGVECAESGYSPRRPEIPPSPTGAEGGPLRGFQPRFIVHKR